MPTILFLPWRGDGEGEEGRDFGGCFLLEGREGDFLPAIPQHMLTNTCLLPLPLPFNTYTLGGGRRGWLLLLPFSPSPFPSLQHTMYMPATIPATVPLCLLPFYFPLPLFFFSSWKNTCLVSLLPVCNITLGSGGRMGWGTMPPFSYSSAACWEVEPVPSGGYKHAFFSHLPLPCLYLLSQTSAFLLPSH